MREKNTRWSLLLGLVLFVLVSGALFFIYSPETAFTSKATTKSILTVELVVLAMAAFISLRKMIAKEKKFNETHNKLSAIFDYSPVGICIVELESGIILDVNQSYVELFGYSKEEAVGKSSVNLGIVIPGERQQLVDEVRKYGFVKNKVIRFKTKSGEVFTCVLSDKLVKINGKECGVVLLNNASVHKDLDDALLENMRKFHQIFESSPTGICMVELETGKILEANISFLKTYGYELNEVVSKTTTEIGLILPEDREAYIAELKKTGSLKNWEQRTYSKEGKQITALLSDTIISIGGNKYSLTFLNDISERKVIEQNLFENQLKLQAIFDSNPGGIALFNLSTGKIKEVNQSFCNICGFSKEELLDHSASELGILPPGIRSSITSNLVYAGAIKNREQIIKTKSGKMITTLYSSIILEVGGEKCSLDIVSDISERKELENRLIAATEKAREAVKSEERFLANMSHEIRTPMNGIIGMVNLLNQTKLNDEQKEYAGWIKDSSEILLTIINDILDISKINAGQMNFEKIPFSIYDILRNLTLTMELQAKLKNIKFYTHIDISVPQKVIGDPVRLFQVLLNLAGNAVKFTEQGEIAISINIIKEDSETINLEFEVRDTGIGIDPAKLPTLFEPFIQAASDTTRKYGGTGLGLSISKRLVEMQGGTIKAKSEPGKGSNFSFELSYKKYLPDAEVKPVKPAREEMMNGRDITGTRILLVEDNRISQRVGMKTMSKWGAIVDIAENGVEAIDKVSNRVYDIVLMDIQMPEMDGFEATKHIRTLLPEPKCNVPIVAMTASVITLDKEKVMEGGMNDYISKPFKPEELYKVISTYALKTESTLENLHN